MSDSAALFAGHNSLCLFFIYYRKLLLIEKFATMVTASIVTYNTPTDELNKCLSSLLCSPVSRVFISDNSPNDGLRRFCEQYDRVEYIFNNANLGYGAGHNVAIRIAMKIESRYHIVLNSDVHFEPEIIGKITDYMESSENVAQLQPKILHPDGTLQLSQRLLPTPLNLISRRFLPNSISRILNSKYTLSFWDHNCTANIPYHQGSFMFFRMDALNRVGLFDERFFMYPEDIDITRRMHKHFKTIYWPNVTIVHNHRAESYRSAKVLFIHIINMIKYFNKWGWIADKERSLWNKQVLQELGYKTHRRS